MGLDNLFRGGHKVFREGPFTPGKRIAKELNWERIHGDPDLKGVSKKEIEKLGEEVDEISGGHSIDKFKLDTLLKRRKIGRGVFEREDYSRIKEQLNEEKSDIEDENLGGQKHDKFAEEDLENN